MTTACPTLNALLLACAGPPLGEPWDAWYHGARLVLADWLEDRDAPGDRLAASLVRQSRPVARGEAPFPAGALWQLTEVRLRHGPSASAPVRVEVAGRHRGEGDWHRLAWENLILRTSATIAGDALRRLPLDRVRVSARIEDESFVTAGLLFRSCRGNSLRGLRALTHHAARRNCRREVLALFAGTAVRVPLARDPGYFLGEDGNPRRFIPGGAFHDGVGHFLLADAAALGRAVAGDLDVAETARVGVH